MRRTIPLLAALLLCACKTRLWTLHDPGSDLDAGSLSSSDLMLPLVCRDIWVVDEDGTFSAFDTQSAEFRDIATLECAPSIAPETMAVDRAGTAWVLYSDGRLFQVDVATAACRPTAFVNTQLSNNQEMGSCFSANTPGGTSETYFVELGTEQSLASINTQSLELTRIARLMGPAELTGTGDAELWGFFPASPTSLIARIDKTTAALDRQISLPQVDSVSVGSFAFAFWGGEFWVFYSTSTSDTAVFRVHPVSGQVTQVLAHTGRHIRGAGTSSCAPVGLDL